MHLIRFQLVLLTIFLTSSYFNSFVVKNIFHNGWKSAYSKKSKVLKDAFISDPEEIRQIIEMLDLPTSRDEKPDPLLARMAKLDEYKELSLTDIESKWKQFCKQSNIVPKKNIAWPDFLPFLFQSESQLLSFPDGIPVPNDLQLLSSTVFVTEAELQKLWKVRKNSNPIHVEREFDLKEALLMLPDEEDKILVGSIKSEEEQAEEVYNPYRKQLAAATVEDGRIGKDGRKKGKNEASTPTVNTSIATDHDMIYIPEIELRRLWQERANASEWGLPHKEFDLISSLLLVDDGDKDVEEYIEAHAKELPIEVLNSYQYLPGVVDILEEKKRNHPTYSSTQTKYEDPELRQYFLKFVNETRLQSLKDYFQNEAKEASVFRPGKFYPDYPYRPMFGSDVLLYGDVHKDMISSTFTQALDDAVPDNRYSMDPFRQETLNPLEKKIIKEMQNYVATDDPSIPYHEDVPIWEKLGLPMGDDYPFTMDFIFHYFGPDYDYRKVAHLLEDEQGNNLYYTAQNVTTFIDNYLEQRMLSDYEQLKKGVEPMKLSEQENEESISQSDKVKLKEEIDWETFDFGKAMDNDALVEQKEIKPVVTKSKKYKVKGPNEYPDIDELIRMEEEWERMVVEDNKLDAAEEQALAETDFFADNFADRLNDNGEVEDKFFAEAFQSSTSAPKEEEPTKPRPKQQHEILKLAPEILPYMKQPKRRKNLQEPTEIIHESEFCVTYNFDERELPRKARRDVLAEYKAKNRYYHFDIEFPDSPYTKEDIYYQLSYGFFTRLLRDCDDDTIGDRMLIEEQYADLRYINKLVKHSPPSFLPEEKLVKGIDPMSMPWSFLAEDPVPAELATPTSSSSSSSSSSSKAKKRFRIPLKPSTTFAAYRAKKEAIVRAANKSPSNPTTISSTTPLIPIPLEPLDNNTDAFLDKEFSRIMQYYNRINADTNYNPLEQSKKRQQWILHADKVLEEYSANTSTKYLNIPYIAIPALPELSVNRTPVHMNNFPFIDMIFNNDLKYRNLTELFANNPSVPPQSSFRYYTPPPHEVAYMHSVKYPKVTYPIYEPIPGYFLPDLSLDANYTNEVMEMKNKLSLLAHYSHPDESEIDISYNTDIEPLHMIGTVRELYDWHPDPQYLPYVIEEEKVEQLQALLDFLNFAAELKSTKDDVLLFHYYGPLRKLLGLTAMCKRIAKECYPATKDLRLETHRDVDPEDINNIPVKFL